MRWLKNTTTTIVCKRSPAIRKSKTSPAPTDEIHDTQCIVPFAYWAPTFIAQNELLNGQTGELVPVSIYPESQAGNAVETSYRVETDEMSLAVQYDARGKWIGLVSDLPAKRKLTYTLQIYKTLQINPKPQYLFQTQAPNSPTANSPDIFVHNSFLKKLVFRALNF